MGKKQAGSNGRLRSFFQPLGDTHIPPWGRVRSPVFLETATNEIIEKSRTVENRRDALFELGRIVATPKVHELIVRSIINPIELLKRHSCGDWGDLCDEDKALNNASAAFRVLIMNLRKKS